MEKFQMLYLCTLFDIIQLLSYDLSYAFVLII